MGEGGAEVGTAVGTATVGKGRAVAVGNGVGFGAGPPSWQATRATARVRRARRDGMSGDDGRQTMDDGRWSIASQFVARVERQGLERKGISR